MGDVTIPRIMTEKPRCHIHSKNRYQTEKRRVKFGLELYASVTFYRRIAKQTNSSFFKKPSEGPMGPFMCTVAHGQRVLRDLQESNMF